MVAAAVVMVAAATAAVVTTAAERRRSGPRRLLRHDPSNGRRAYRRPTRVMADARRMVRCEPFAADRFAIRAGS
jgi:hypothetical protein